MLPVQADGSCFEITFEPRKKKQIFEIKARYDLLFYTPEFF